MIVFPASSDISFKETVFFARTSQIINLEVDVRSDRLNYIGILQAHSVVPTSKKSPNKRPHRDITKNHMGFIENVAIAP